MREKTDYETPVSFIKRLIEQDKSEKFHIYVKISKKNFVVNNKKINQKSNQNNKVTICTTINKARVISKRINELYLIDPTINEYYLTIPINKLNNKAINYGQIEETLKLLIKSIQEKISISQDQKPIFSLIRYLLGESDNDIEKELESKIGSQEEAISLLCTNFHKESIEYLSGHFSELIESGEMRNLSDDILIEILDSYLDDFRHKNFNETEKETEIHKIFEDLKNEGERKLLMHFLLSLNPDEYKEEMTNYIYDNIDDEIIQNELPKIIHVLKNHITKIFETTKSDKSTKTEKSNQVKIEFKKDELNGVFQYLQKNYGDDLEKKNLLKISGGGQKNPDYPLTNLIKFNENDRNQYYYNFNKSIPNENDNWIEFDFMNNKINISSYTIRTKTVNHCPSSWKIIGSNNHKNWELIDRQINNPELNGSYKQHRFDIENNNNYYRYIRYVQESSWHNNPQFKYCIYLTCFEFFGTFCSALT